MARKTTTTNDSTDLMYSFDAGNGNCKGISSETKSELVQFAPVIAPLTGKKDTDADSKPHFSLALDGERKERDKSKPKDVLVFGVDDVFQHGKRTAIRRLNSAERYLSPDYFRLLDVLYLQCFSAHRGGSDYIKPKGVISVPVSQYNNDDVTGEIRATLLGSRTLEDYEGCTLRLTIEDKHLTVIPESTGAMTHYAFDPNTLKKRTDAPTAGVTLVIDIGYETTDVSLFEGMAYQRDQSFTVPRAGMGVIVRAIQDYARKELRDADASRIDRGMRLIARTKPGAPKSVEAAPGIRLDVSSIYDSELEQLGNFIADEVSTRFSGTVSRALLAGGGAYHLIDVLNDRLPFQDVLIAPDPDAANVFGAYTLMRLKEQAGR